MSLYSAAAAGTLDKEALVAYLNVDHGIDAPSTQEDGTRGLTALALAAVEGHVDTVKLLLDHGAGADALSEGHRTPLWIVTARGKGRERAKIVDLLLGKGADAKYSHPQLLNSSTPLMNEISQRKDLSVIRLLVRADGITLAAIQLAKQRKMEHVLITGSEISKLFIAMADKIMAFVLYIIGWANALGRMVNAIFDKFGIKGWLKIPGVNTGTPQTQRDFKTSASSFIRKHNLEDFFPSGGGRFLETLVNKAVELQKDKTTPLGRVGRSEDLVKLAMYQPIIYCDDSSSMGSPPSGSEPDRTRMDVQAELVERIASICTRLIPDDLGVHLRFINKKLPSGADNLRMDGIRNQMARASASGSTAIGTNLRQQILDPFVYNVGKMTRPLFVSVITDGVPSEDDKIFQNEILACRKYLCKKGLPERAVIFQISQVGNDESSEKFLRGLHADTSLKGVLYVTAQKLDSTYSELRRNEDHLEAWLVETLVNPILDASKE